MPEKQRDPWRTEDAGLPDDFDHWITNAYFAVDPRYTQKAGEERLMLHLEGESLGNEDMQPIRISCSKGFVTVDGGKTAQHEAGEETTAKGFNRNSNIRKFVNRVLEFPGAEQALKKSDKKGLGPLDATVWLGFGFHWKREIVEYGRGIDPQEKLLPTAFLGIKGTTPGAAAPAASPTPTATPVSSDVLRTAVTALAGSCNAYTEFLQKALMVPGITNDQTLLGEVMNEAGGIWAQVKK